MDTTDDRTQDGSILEQYKHHSAKFLRQRLKEQINARQKVTPGSTEVFASILFADISGFTQLSSRLSAEELKTHINEYFTKLLSVIDENSGDVVKFCGDAVLIMWALPLDAAEEERQAAVLMSALCALQLLEECGEYRKTVAASTGAHHRSSAAGGSTAHISGSSAAQPAVARVLGARSKTVLNLSIHASTAADANADGTTSGASPSPLPTRASSDTLVELSLHCGISCGAVHCMTLGDSQRMEFLLSGSPIQQMGAAEAAAHAGQVCMHPEAYALVQDVLHAEPVLNTPGAEPPAPATEAPAEADRQVSAPDDDAAMAAAPAGDREAAEASEEESATSPPPPTAYLLTGKLADAFVDAQLRRRETRSAYVKASADLGNSLSRSATRRLAPGSPDLSEESDAFPAADMTGDSTSQYLANLARKVTASQTKPQLRRVRGKISGADVRLVAQSDGADEETGADQFPSPDANADTSGTHASSVQKAATFGTSARHGLLSRFRSSKLRASFASSLCSEAENSDNMSNKESMADTGSATAAGAQLSPTRTLSTGKTSFLYSGAVGTAGDAGSPAHGKHAGPRGMRQQLQSRMSSALISTRSSLALLPLSWSSTKELPSRTHTGSRSHLASAEEAAEERSVSRHYPSMRSAQKDSTKTGEERSWRGGSMSWHRGASALSAVSSTGPVVTEATCPTTIAQARSTLSRPLPVAVLKRKLKFGTAASFEAVRDYQNNWNRVAESADAGLAYHAAARRGSSSLRRNSAMVSSKRVRLTQELRKFVHETAARAVDSGTVAFLSEVRDVAVVFTQVLDLDRSFHLGQHGRPQKVFCAILRALRQFGGSLRQFVVDDKGCVAIGCFGLSGSSSQNNCVQAVDYALSLRALLQTLGSRSASGITLGTVYCGLVGAGSRCEYAVMGSSVNLAARLMAACAKELKASEAPSVEGESVSPNKRFTRAGTMLQRRQGVLIDASVHHVTHHQFQFEQLANIHAKGYADPVKVFSALRKRSGSRQIDTIGCADGADTVLHHQRASQYERSTVLPLLLEREAAMNTVQCCFAPAAAAPPLYFSSHCASALLVSPPGPTFPAVVVTGPPGSGRSAFLHHAVESLRHASAGARIAEVKVDPANQYLPFDLVRELLSQVLDIQVGSKRGSVGDTLSEPIVDPALSRQLALCMPNRAAEGVTSTRSSTVTTASRFSTISVAAINAMRLRRSSAARSQSTPWRRRGTVASSSACETPAETTRRRCSTGVTFSETQRSRARSMCGTIAESDPAPEPLSPHTLRFFPHRLATAMESAATTTTSSSGTSAGSMEVNEAANAKLLEWSAQHLPPTLSLSTAFALCYPSLDLYEVLHYQRALQDRLGSAEDGGNTAEGEEEILLELCRQPLRCLLHLLNASLGTTLPCDPAVPCGKVSLAEAMQRFLSPELSEVLGGVLLHALLLTALGVCLCPEGDTPPHPHCPGWTFAVDDLHLADLESQTLLCNVINTAQRQGVNRAGHAGCGGILVTTAVAEATAADAPRIATVSTVTHTNTHTHTTATPSAARQRRRRGSILHSVHCTSPADLLAHMSRAVDSTQAHEQVMLLLRLHCEVVELQRLSLSAVRELLIHTLGARNWVWLLSHAAQALGAQGSHPHRPTEIGLHCGGSIVRARRSSFAAGSGSQRAASTPSSKIHTAIPAATSPPGEFALRRNAVSASQARWNSVRSRFLSGRPHPDRRPSENTVTADSSAVLRSREALAMTAAAAAAVSHPSRTSAYCTQAEHDALIALIYALSGNGLPSYVTEISVSLRDTISCGAFLTIQEVPAVVRRSKLILEVLDGLSGMEVAVLKAAAVVGGAFTVPLLSATLAGMDLPQCSDVLMLSDVLHSLVSAGLVRAASPESEVATCATPYGDGDGAASYEFVQTSTQLAIYSLMLEAQRAAAHSVVAAYLEHTHRCLCAPPQLLQIAHHYLLSGNTKKKIEYLRRTAECSVLQGNIADAIGNYAEMVHIAVGSSVEELVEACRTRLVDNILAARSNIRRIDSPTVATVLVAVTAPVRPASRFAFGAVLRCTRFRLFSNQVVSAGEEPAIVRPARKTASARAGLRPDPRRPPTAPAGIPLQDLAEAHLSALSLAELVLRWLVTARTLLVAGGDRSQQRSSLSEPLPDVKVKDAVALLGIGIEEVAGWVSRVADLLSSSGAYEEALELTALALLLHEQDVQRELPVAPEEGAASPPPRAHAKRRRSLLPWAAQDDGTALQSSVVGDPADSHATREAMQYLDRVTAQAARQRTQRSREVGNTKGGIWSGARTVQAWLRTAKTTRAGAHASPEPSMAAVATTTDGLRFAIDELVSFHSTVRGGHCVAAADTQPPAPSVPARSAELLLRLAKSALTSGRALEAAAALEPVLLHDPDNLQCDCWAVMSAALRCLGCHSESMRCMVHALLAAADTGDFPGGVGFIAAWHLSASGHISAALDSLAKAAESLEVTDTALEKSPGVGASSRSAAALLANWTLRGWLLVLSGDVAAAQKIAARIRDRLSGLRPDTSGGVAEPTYVQETQWLHQLEVMLCVCNSGLCMDEPPAALLYADQDAGKGYHFWVTTTLREYYLVLQSADRETAPMSTSQISTALRTIISQLRGWNVDASDSTVFPKIQHARCCTSLPAGVLLFLSLHTSMKQLERVLIALLAAGLSDAEEAHQEDILKAVTAIAHGMACFRTLCSGAFTGLRPMHAMLCVQYELLFHQLCEDFSGGSGSSRNSLRNDARTTSALADLVLRVFPQGSFKAAAFSSTNSLPGSPFRMKPQAPSSSEQRGSCRGGARKTCWWGLSLWRRRGDRAVADLAALGARGWGSPDRGGGQGAPAALLDYQRGFSVAKLQRLRAFLQSHVRADPATAGDPYQQLAKQCCQAALHGEGEDGSAGIGGGNETSDSDGEQSGSQESGPAGDAMNRGGAHVRGVSIRRGRGCTVQVSSATNTGASAAELFLSSADTEKHAGVRWELFPFVRRIYDDLSQEIDALEERSREKLCRYVSQLMERMECS